MIVEALISYYSSLCAQSADSWGGCTAVSFQGLGLGIQIGL